MRIWLAYRPHFVFPNEWLSPKRIMGLIFAVVGVALAFVERPDEGKAHLIGDIMAVVSALGWAGIVLCARATRISEEPAETVLFSPLLASGPLLSITALFFKTFIREINIFGWISIFFQRFVAGYGFFFLVSIYSDL